MTTTAPPAADPTERTGLFAALRPPQAVMAVFDPTDPNETRMKAADPRLLTAVKPGSFSKLPITLTVALPEMCGWLQKEGGHTALTKSYELRWCILAEQQLSYYKKREDKKPAGNTIRIDPMLPIQRP